jgi:hypothetical protein
MASFVEQFWEVSRYKTGKKPVPIFMGTGNTFMCLLNTSGTFSKRRPGWIFVGLLYAASLGARNTMVFGTAPVYFSTLPTAV